MMTPRQKQGIMGITSDANGKYYYEGPLDGIWGPKSKEAAERFLADFSGQVEEAPKKPPDSFWDELEYFDREEFRCQCNGKYCDGFHVEPDETMVRICDEIRRRAGVPILIRDAGGSGLRCPQWNATIPGACMVHHHGAGLHPGERHQAGRKSPCMAD